MSTGMQEKMPVARRPMAMMIGGPKDGEIKRARPHPIIRYSYLSTGGMNEVRYELAKAVIPISETEARAFYVFRFMRKDGSLEGFQGHEKKMLDFAFKYGEDVEMFPAEIVN